MFTKIVRNLRARVSTLDLKRIATFAVLVAASVLVMAAPAMAASTGGGVLPGGNHDLKNILADFGINTNFNLMDLVSFMLKPVAIYYILHGVYDAHEAWKATGYKPKEFTHAVIGAGGTGLLIGGGAGIASATIGGSGATFF